MKSTEICSLYSMIFNLINREKGCYHGKKPEFCFSGQNPSMRIRFKFASVNVGELYLHV